MIERILFRKRTLRQLEISEGIFMHHKWYSATEVVVEQVEGAYLHSETIEVNRLSALAFFAAGNSYKGKRFFWQNRAQTKTIVGIGHAFSITNNSDETRFDEVEQKWMRFTEHMALEKDDFQPILFGGFSFDPQNDVQDEWESLPQSVFHLATFQLVMHNEKNYVTVHYVSNSDERSETFDLLVKERDQLIHAAQVKEVRQYEKPVVCDFAEPFKEEYLKSIDVVTSQIKAGQAEKVVIARSLALQFEEAVTSTQVLSQVKNEQPESYLFGLEGEGFLFFGASPERLVRVENGKGYSSCVAGSIRRGKTAEEDELLGEKLLGDEKNRGEHHYVVEMITETFAENCTNVSVPDGPKLLKIRDIQHLFTPVEGQLKDGATILQLVKSLHPTPALGGVPREASLEMIRRYEPMNRGLYAAPIGWVDAEGNGEFAVAIRSALLKDERAYLYAGGGIVGDSDATSEYEETLVKFRPMLRALGGIIHE